MPRKPLKVFLLIIIIGIPVIWYLFLQVFGENKFDLTNMGRLDCINDPALVLVTDSLFTTAEDNELQRIRKASEQTAYSIQINAYECLKDSANQVYLFDQNRNLRGSYLLTMEDIDRFVVEFDLLMTLESDGE